MRMRMTGRMLLLCGAAGLALASCLSAPAPGYETTVMVTEKRTELVQRLLNMLPPEQREAAREEARWLSDTAYKGAAAIGRYNHPRMKGWMNNVLVNTKKSWQERGLCWHYQHDIFRELRRRPLVFYRLGCGVMDQGDGGEHHCVYIVPAQGPVTDEVILDAWINSGRLKIYDNDKAKRRGWTDEPDTTAMLEKVYPEGHTLPLEHWLMVRKGEEVGKYVRSDTAEGRQTRQGRYMIQMMHNGLKARRGNPIPYQVIL